MKKIRKVISTILILAMAIVLGEGLEVRQAEASSPSDAGTLSLNSGWSSDHYLTETDNEHWYKMVVPSDGKVQIKIMHYMYSVHLQISTSDLSDNFFSESSYNPGFSD